MNGFIYITQERNSDGSIITHDGLTKIGVGRTNNLERRFKEHNTGSKSTVGVSFVKTLDCDTLDSNDVVVEKLIHDTLKKLGFFVVERKGFIYDTENTSNTEVFSGKAKKTIKGLVEKGEQINVELIVKIVSASYNIDLFKDELIMLPHQEKAMEFVLNKFNGGVKNVLLNKKPRSGKTYVTYEYLIKEKPKNVLLLTQYPALNDQWKVGLEGLRGHDYNIIISRDVKKVVLDEERENLVMISLQDAKGSDIDDEAIVSGLKKQKFSQLSETHWDLIIFDEIHKGKETKKTDELLNSLVYDKLLGLSATPTKNILNGTFELENIFKYTLKEEQEYKRLYPLLYKNPNINYLLFNISDEVKTEMDFFTKEEGFTFSKFSRVKSGRLVYQNDHIKLFRWLFGLGRYRKSSPSFKVVNECKSILMFVNNNECQEHIQKMLQELVGDIYDVHYTNSDVTSTNSLIKKVKNEYVPKDGKKSIIIANRQLTTGVTLEKCDCVLFMNDWKSVDEYIQASYRCQSPSDGKEECYVIDLNPSRAFNLLYSFIESDSTIANTDIEKDIREFLECTPIFENFGNELKKIDFEGFKQRFIDTQDFGRDFFPKSVIRPMSDVETMADELLSLGKLESDSVTSKEQKLDEEAPDAGKNQEKEGVSGEKKEKKPTEEENKLMEKMLSNVDFIRDRLHIISIVTELQCESVYEAFEMMDKDEELRDLFIEELMIETILK